MNLQAANFQRCKVHLHVQSCRLVHMSGIHFHEYASFASGSAFVYFTVEYYVEYRSTVCLFQAQDVQKCKSSSDVAGTAGQLLYYITALSKVLYYMIKNVLLFAFLCTICVKSIINLLQFSTI